MFAFKYNHLAKGALEGVATVEKGRMRQLKGGDIGHKDRNGADSGEHRVTLQ